MLTVKKILTFPLVILLVIVLLVSCKDKFFSNGGVDPLEVLQDGSYEGIIEALPAIDVYQQGTHLLFDVDGKSIIIQSQSIDLNKYLDEDVKVEGEVAKSIGDAHDVLTIINIEYLDESRTQELSSYENKLYGFRLDHPSIWLSKEDAGLSLNFEEENIVSIKVFNDEDDLDSFVKGEEEYNGTEVTIGAQRSVRFLSDGNMRFYVPNPPKKKIYVIKYTPVINKVDDEEGAKEELGLFYDLLESFELIYFTQLSGDKCGGLQKVECSEDYRCELEGAGEYAKGVCVPVESEVSTTSCPFIATPATCHDYRISEYSKNGCPARYECVGEEGESIQPTFRDLNVVDAGKNPVESTEGIEDINILESSTINESKEVIENATIFDYEIPEVNDISREYVNTRKNFSVLYPKNWYFASFGSVDGSIWTIGFSDKELEDVQEAIITLSLKDKSSGRVSKKIDDIYYILDGPEDLTGVMEVIADSVEAF